MTSDPLEEIKVALANLRRQLGPNVTVCISREYPIGRWRRATAGDDIYFMVHPATLEAAFASRTAEQAVFSYGVPVLDLDTPPAEPGAFLKWSVLKHEIHRQVAAAASADRQLDKIFKKDSE